MQFSTEMCCHRLFLWSILLAWMLFFKPKPCHMLPCECMRVCNCAIHAHCSQNLTWRDMQHLVVQTSHPAHLLANDWRTNGVGRKGTANASNAFYKSNIFNAFKKQTNMLIHFGNLHSCVTHLFSPIVSAVSHSYGYGLLDAGAIVSLAKNWTNVKPQRKCVITMLSEPRLVHCSLTNNPALTIWSPWQHVLIHINSCCQGLIKTNKSLCTSSK